MAKIEVLPNGNIRVKVLVTVKNFGNRKRIIQTATNHPSQISGDIPPLVTMLARALRWRKLIDDGQIQDAGALAQHLGLDRTYVDRVLRFNFLSPEVIHSIITNSSPEELTIKKLRGSIPVLWSEQKKQFKI